MSGYDRATVVQMTQLRALSRELGVQPPSRLTRRQADRLIAELLERRRIDQRQMKLL